MFVNDKALARVLSASADTARQPVTAAEQAFVTLVLAHISSVYFAMNVQLVINLDGLRRDMVQFLSLPIPRAVWEKIKVLQKDDFVAAWNRAGIGNNRPRLKPIDSADGTAGLLTTNP